MHLSLGYQHLSGICFCHVHCITPSWSAVVALYHDVKHCLDFSFVFSAPLPAWRNLFSASGIICGGRYQPGCTGILWPAEGTSQAVLGSHDQRKVPASLSLFLEIEKIPDQLCLTEENDLSTDPSPIYLQLPYYYLSSQDTNYIILRNVHILKKILFRKNQEKKFVKENEEPFRIVLNVLLFHWESSKWSNQWNNYSTLKHWTCHVTTVIHVVDPLHFILIDFALGTMQSHLYRGGHLSTQNLSNASNIEF
jgi:hypothetical protein